MDNNSNDQIEYLLKNRQMAEYFRTSKMKKWSMVNFHSSLLKTVEYSMEATRLNNAQWEQVIKPLLPIALKKAGSVRTFPRVMVHSSKKY